ncbi:MAG: MaoC family dehydratase N-terminal domain-containing protein [Mycobacterium sp.]
MMDTLLTPEVIAAIGREWPPVVHEVDRAGIRMWANAVGIIDPVFHDENVARARGFDGLPAPPGFVGVPRQMPGEDDPGPPIRGLHPDLGRSLNGGTEFEYLAPILAGDELEATTSIVDIQEREGSIGPMLLITRETTYRRHGEAVAFLRATVINY